MDKRVNELRERLWKKKAALQQKENVPVSVRYLITKELISFVTWQSEGKTCLWGKPVQMLLLFIFFFLSSGGSLVLLKYFSWYVGVNLLTLYGQKLSLCCCGFF